MPKHSVTLQDLAKELNLSPSTVSRALKDNPEISEKTILRVKALAKERNYRPNHMAVMLRKQTSKLIGVVVPSLSNNFFSKVISGMAEVLNKHGYNILLCQSNNDGTIDDDGANFLLSQRVDGVLASANLSAGSSLYFREIVDNETPLVLFDQVPTGFEECTKVQTDNFEGGKEAAKHLVAKGNKDIRILTIEGNHALFEKRKQGFLEGLKESGYEVKADTIVEVPNVMEEDGLKAAKQLFDHDKKPDAIFTITDFLAIGFYNFCKTSPLEIGKDFSLICFTDAKINRLLDPPLSAITHPDYEMGVESAQLLIEEIESKAKKLEWTPTVKKYHSWLEERDSSSIER